MAKQERYASFEQIAKLKKLEIEGLIGDVNIHQSSLHTSLRTFQFKLRAVIIQTPSEKIDSDFSRYTISIKYGHKTMPTVHILTPEIDEQAPHRFANKSLCLYKASNFQWNNGCSLSLDIVPLVFMWIYFYEDWLENGKRKWKGDEAKH